jgi:hypothetical protein
LHLTGLVAAENRFFPIAHRDVLRRVQCPQSAGKENARKKNRHGTVKQHSGKRYGKALGNTDLARDPRLL